MSRYHPRHDNSNLYAAANAWLKRSLLGEGSILSADQHLWSDEKLDELDRNFVNNLDEGEGGFLEKLRTQLANGTSQSNQLMAELLWLILLFPSNIGATSKRSTVREIWSWSNNVLPNDHELLSEQVLWGIGSAGTAYNTHRWREVAFAITAIRNLRALDPDAREEVICDPWKFMLWLQSVPGAKQRQLLHILPHLLFPDTFERISSGGDKKQILAALTSEPKRVWDNREPIEWDRALYALRQQLEAEADSPIDFYSEELEPTWRLPASRSAAQTDPVTTGFASALTAFLEAYREARSGPFTIGGPLAAAMNGLKTWIERSAPVVERPTIRVRLSVGQGGWTKTPWIALLDQRVTSSTQRGIYVVFLVAEDLSVTHLTLNQGMTDLVDRHGQTGAVAEMTRVAQEARPKIAGIVGDAFALDSNISLASTTTAARNYEVGTIAHAPLNSTALPTDAPLLEQLEKMLQAYDRLIEGEGKGEGGDVSREAPLPPYTLNDALKELFLEREAAEELMLLWRAKRNVILQGPPGVGKSFAAQKLAFALMGEANRERLGFVQFHQSYSYEDFVEGYRPCEDGFELRSGKFVKFCRKAAEDAQNTYVFIIDEINRGNLSKILGELMLLIEADKRSPSWRMPLASGTEEFFVPENVYLLGLMNTADRSLAVVDYALRRRFAFVDLEPGLNTEKFRQHLSEIGISQTMRETLIHRIGMLNAEIISDTTNLGPGFAIGHSYFCSRPLDGEHENAWYSRIVRWEILPLLSEYWFDAPSKVENWKAQLLGPL